MVLFSKDSLPVVPSQASISSGFGERSDPMNRRVAMHSGLDFELPLHTPVLAAGGGTVIESGGIRSTATRWLFATATVTRRVTRTIVNCRCAKAKR